MVVPFFDITRQNEPLKKELHAALRSVADSGKYILGENVTAFENEFAAYCGTKHAIGVASGTDALHLALVAAGVGPGDEVITAPFTFVATAEAIAYCGAKPVFVDVEAKTFNIDPSKVAAKITKKTKAFLPVHLYGLACQMDPIVELAKKHNLAIIEDCAQATGSIYSNSKVGSFGLGCFSFFPTKNLGCFGDGGIITTNSEDLSTELRVIRNHGTRKAYHHDIIGYNSRLDALQAAILRIKLAKIDKYVAQRRKNAAFYAESLKEIEQIALPTEAASDMHTYNQFTIMVDQRDALVSHLKGKSIGAMIYYPVSLHLQKAFAYLGHKSGDFPVCEDVQSKVLSLPIFPELKEAELAEVCSAIKEFYHK